MTLIEVLAGLVVLGTVLTGILLIRSRYTRQLNLAEKRLAAIAQADQLIESWLGGEVNGVPVSGTGALGETFVWRTSPAPFDEAARRLASQIVRLEVLSAADITARRVVPAALVQVDLLVPGLRPAPVADEPQDEEDAAATQPTTRPAELYVDPRLLEGPQP
jgi:hypothetical protein